MVDFHDSVYTKNKGVARRAGGRAGGTEPPRNLVVPLTLFKPEGADSNSQTTARPHPDSK